MYILYYTRLSVSKTFNVNKSDDYVVQMGEILKEKYLKQPVVSKTSVWNEIWSLGMYNKCKRFNCLDQSS